MKIGIIAEYNPFHNGHLYQIKKIKELYPNSYIIVALSPNFNMRGEISIIDKYEKAKIAINNMVDLVIEIPTVYTIQNASVYASKAIKLLNEFNIDLLAFGATSSNEELTQIVEIESSDEYNNLLNRFLKEGNSFNSSSKKAILSINKNLEDIINEPNNLLGVEYLKEIKKYNISPLVIKRINNNYYDNDFNDSLIQSATSIRNQYKTKDVSKYLPYEPHFNVIDYKVVFKMIKYRLAVSTVDELKEILGVTEGMEYLLYSLKDSNSLEELTNKLISKRNRETKIKRILLALLLNIKKTDQTDLNYIHILGFSEKGKELLKTNTSIPIITNYHKDMDSSLLKELDYSRIYDLITNGSSLEKELDINKR